MYFSCTGKNRKNHILSVKSHVFFSEKSALLASLFITNLKNNNEGEDYFRDVRSMFISFFFIDQFQLEHADDIYTHTWSLSVEIQFYLLAPLLLHVMKVINHYPLFKIVINSSHHVPIPFTQWDISSVSLEFHLSIQGFLPLLHSIQQLQDYGNSLQEPSHFNFWFVLFIRFIETHDRFSERTNTSTGERVAP